MWKLTNATPIEPCHKLAGWWKMVKSSCQCKCKLESTNVGMSSNVAQKKLWQEMQITCQWKLTKLGHAAQQRSLKWAVADQRLSKGERLPNQILSGRCNDHPARPCAANGAVRGAGGALNDWCQIGVQKNQIVSRLG